MMVPSSLNPQHLLIALWVVAILTGVRWHIDDVLICISFIAKEVEHFFIFLFAIFYFF
jgi:uncharacterized membrane protein (GlpM family)